MSQEAIAIYALAGSILAYAVLWFFKSPKEINGELSEQLAGLRDETRVNAQLTARHDERIGTLIIAINRLTDRIDRMEPMVVRPNGRRGP